MGLSPNLQTSASADASVRSPVSNPQLEDEPKTWFEVEAVLKPNRLWSPGDTSARRTERLFYHVKLNFPVIYMMQWDRDLTDGGGPSADTEFQYWPSILQPGHELWLHQLWLGASSVDYGAIHDIGPVRMEVYCACV